MAPRFPGQAFRLLRGEDAVGVRRAAPVLLELRPGVPVFLCVACHHGRGAVCCADGYRPACFLQDVCHRGHGEVRCRCAVWRLRVFLRVFPRPAI